MDKLWIKLAIYFLALTTDSSKSFYDLSLMCLDFFFDFFFHLSLHHKYIDILYSLTEILENLLPINSTVTNTTVFSITTLLWDLSASPPFIVVITWWKLRYRVLLNGPDADQTDRSLVLTLFYIRADSSADSLIPWLVFSSWRNHRNFLTIRPVPGLQIVYQKSNQDFQFLEPIHENENESL